MSKSSNPIEQGLRVKNLRKKLRLSRRAFSLRQNISTGTLQAIEDGLYKNGLSLNATDMLINAFRNEGYRVQQSWLLHGDGEAPKTISALKLESAQSQSPKNHNEILELTDINKEIMINNNKLIKAVRNNNISKLEIAIKNGANIHKLKEKELYGLLGRDQDTILHYAAKHSDRNIVELIITKLGIHPNIRNRNMDSPAHLACYTNNIPALRTLIEYDANLEASSREGATPLIWAAFLGNIEAIQELLKHYVQINNTDNYGNTAVHWAAYNNQMESLKYLLANGASMHIKNHDKLRPIDHACKNGHYESVEFLVKCKS